MARCRSWRPVARVREGHYKQGEAWHAPGACRRCWKLCRNRVRKGTARCEQCARALVDHPSAKVRALLVAEGPRTVPREVMELLAFDMDAGVKLLAGQMLDTYPSETEGADGDPLAAAGSDVGNDADEPSTGSDGDKAHDPQSTFPDGEEHR